MAQKIRGITVEIGGDTSGLQKSLKDTNKEIKSTQSQLKDVEKLLKLDPKNVELLRQKQKLLNDAVNESNKKLDVLRQTEARLKDAGVDKNSEQFMALEREIQATTLAASGYETELKQVGDAAEENASKTEKGTAALSKAKSAWMAVAAAAVAAATAIAKGVTETAAYADDILTMSSVTGMSTEKLQQYSYAAELVDVSMETLSGSLKKNLNAMKSAANGTGSAAEAYEKLGVSVTDNAGKLRDSETVYWEAIDALGTISDETERDALAMDIFGKSATELNPLIEKGSKGLKDLAKEAENAGYIMSEDTLESFGSFDDELKRLQNGATATKNALSTAFLPALKTVVTEGTGIMKELTDVVSNSDGDIGDMIAGFIEVVVAHIPDLVKGITEVTLKVIEGIGEALPDILPSLVECILDIVNYLLEPATLEKLIVAVLKVVWGIIVGVFKIIPKLLAGLGDLIGEWLFPASVFSTSGSSSLPAFANGGSLSSGAALVGEAGPELLTVSGGRATVTPLTSGSQVAASSPMGGGEQIITIQFNGELATLGQILEPYVTSERARIGGSIQG